MLVTIDIYAHVTPGMQEEAALRFEEALQQAEDRKQKSYTPIA